MATKELSKAEKVLAATRKRMKKRRANRQKVTKIEWAKMKDPPARVLELPFLETYTRESVIAEFQRVSRVTGSKIVREADMRKYGRVSSPTVSGLFGSFRLGVEAAGLTCSAFPPRTRVELLKLLRKLWFYTLRKNGRAPVQTDLAQYGCPASHYMYQKEFGSWRRAMMEASKFQCADDAETITFSPVPIDRARREKIRDRTRFLVFKRDKYTCQICGKSGGQLEVDHIIPVAKGGSSDLDNLQTACYKCNRGKKDDLQYKEEATESTADKKEEAALSEADKKEGTAGSETEKKEPAAVTEPQQAA